MALAISQLAVRLGERNILRDVSLSVSGPLTFLLGLNGSGKTTLLRAIAGEVDYRGTIQLDGTDLGTLSAKERALRIAWVQQRPVIPFRLTVFDFVQMGRFAHLNWLGNYSVDDKERALAALARMQVMGLADRNLDQISGGELQRVLLARALCQDADWLLLDEPGQQLDPRRRVQLYELLEEMAAEGKFILCTTHDREATEQTESRVVGIRDGRIVHDGQGGEWNTLWQKVYG